MRMSRFARVVYGFCFFAIRPYQTLEAMKTTLQPAVNQTRNGTGR
jgi:hypothetical protein